MRIFQWDTVQDFFGALNSHNIKYVVMRNFEDMDKEDFFMDGHEDLDILCEDVTGFIETSKIIRKMIPEDDVHFVTFISGKTIPVDLRHQGDNYYDGSWEKDILDRRRLSENGNWYVMLEEDYYYTLVYHAILQKKEVNPQYIDKLNMMAGKLGICTGNKEEHLKNLDSYMKRQGYQYVQPEDSSVPFQWKYINHTQRKSFVNRTNMIKNGKLRSLFLGGGIFFSKRWDGIHI